MTGSNTMKTKTKTPDINKILKLEAHEGCSKYGAQMGRMQQLGDPPGPLYLQRLKFIDGDYDTGGAYWGGGFDVPPMWCAFSVDTEDDTMIFARAASRELAKEAVLAAIDCQTDDTEGWTFRR